MSATNQRAWQLHEYGQPLEVLRLEEVAVAEPGPGQIRVKTEAIPLNLNDLDRITGGSMMVKPEFPYSPGMEVCGIVEAVGEGADVWLGRRVAATPEGAFGGFSERCVCQAVSAFELPEDIPLPDAAALYFPFHLAWMGLYDRAQLRQGESVLIHAAAGGAGSAAIQLAKVRGATVFATAGNAEKLALCRELGADHVINYNTDDFCEAVLDLTDNRGVDVVFDTVGQAVMEKSLHCTAYNGRYLMMGFASDKAVADEPTLVPRRLALGNLSICGVILAYADQSMIDGLKRGIGWNFSSRAQGEVIHAGILNLYRDGLLRPVVGRQIGFEDIPQALADLAARKTTGRVIAVL